jgi:alpha-L-arabinofuranosidase
MKIIYPLSLLATATLACAADPTLTIHADQPGAKINPAMWGVFFEDINFGADGGIYAEMVKNRGFEFPDALMGWTKISPSMARGALTIRDDAPFNAANPHYVRIRSEAKAPFGISNNGFRGMGVRKGEAYQFSARIRGIEGKPLVRVQIYGGDGTLLDNVDLKDLAGDWQKVSATLRPNETSGKAWLAVLIEGAGTVDFDFISLFPEKTWKNRPGGMRADMIQALADMKPGFIRFPGGCIVEGTTLATRYQWKNTIGPVEERKLLVNRWNHEFIHRPTPDYYQTFGLGFFEYFQLCEDIGAQPLPILNCGIACQFNSGELCPLDQLGPYIQDALDLIEFANGPVDSIWGAKRAAMGHPEPFNMRMLGIGNENWDTPYFERYGKFHQVLKEKHPEIELISSSGPSPDDARFKSAWAKLRELKAEVIDEHCYNKPAWFYGNARRYDGYDRNGPKVFMGEYAAQSDKVVSSKNVNNFDCALSEAAFLTGLERNADVVRLASYAPLFAHTEAWQWTPNMIWVDNLNLSRTPSYYVQQMYSRNRGDTVLPLDLTSGDAKLFANAVRDNAAGDIIVKVVNAGDTEATVKVSLDGAATVASDATATVLSGNLSDVNTVGQAEKIKPVASKISLPGKSFPQVFPARSFTVLRVKAD